MTTNRRYDLDWIRVIAIGLLLVYHVAIGFQPWGVMIGFITNQKSWESLWLPMMMLNVWRIPLLFFVSGMGVYFAMQNRNWKQLLADRSARILFPYLIGIFVIVPVHIYLWRIYYNMDLIYTADPGHLWFLGNIFVYVIIFLPLFYYLKNNQDGKIARSIKSVFATPLGLLLMTASFIVEAMILKPFPYELYATTAHGFFLGLLAFLFGFCFVLSGERFWNMILKWRWVFLSIAVVLFAIRLTVYPANAPMYLLVPESNCWILTVFAFGYKYLNRPGKTLNYLSQAAYPVYILHMIFLYLGSLLVFRLEVAAPVQFILLLLFTSAGCLVFYEFVVRRINAIRPWFGLKVVKKGEAVVSGI